MTRCKVALVFYLTIIRDLCNRIVFALCWKSVYNGSVSVQCCPRSNQLPWSGTESHKTQSCRTKSLWTKSHKTKPNSTTSHIIIILIFNIWKVDKIPQCEKWRKLHLLVNNLFYHFEYMLVFMLDSVCILVALSDIICTNDVTNKLCHVSNEVTHCGCQYLAVFI